MNTGTITLCLSAALLVAAGAISAATPLTPASVSKPSVSVHTKPDFASPAVTTLSNGNSVNIAGQQGLWYQLDLGNGKVGYVRVNEVRVAYGSKSSGGIAKALFSGSAGKGRVTETASVRGLDESQLKAASFDAEQLQKMESYRATPAEGERAAAKHGWQATQVAYADEYQPSKQADQGSGATQQEKRSRFGAARGFLSMVAPSLASTAEPGEKLIGKSDTEVKQEELELGPLIAGRILGAAPLVNDSAVQRRINTIGRWVASRTSRPDLPWTFGVIQDDEINAFAAPGGYILMTSGLYRLLDDDAELAGALGHEIGHVVQQDHYKVIRKQEMMSAGGSILSSQIHTGGGVAGSLARNYIEKHGAAIMLTSLDRGAEYHADRAAEIYLARAGANPLAFYAVLQKMAALGSSSPRLTSLYKTHPSLDKRLDAIDKQSNGKLAVYMTR